MTLDERVLAAIRGRQHGATAVEVAEAIGAGYRDVLDALERLHADRRIRLGGRLGAWAPTDPDGAGGEP